MVYSPVQGSHSAVQYNSQCIVQPLGWVFTPTIISLSLLPESIARTLGIRQRERERGIIIKYKQSDSDLNIVSGNLHKVIPTRATSSRKI